MRVRSLIRTRPVTLIVPFAAGGPGNITGRIVADQLSWCLGSRLLVENVAGAGGTTGRSYALHARRRTATPLVQGHMARTRPRSRSIPILLYNPETDFEPIGLVAEYPEVLVTRKDLPPNDLREFVAYAKANEAKLNMAHAGVGSVSHTGCLLLNAAIGIKPTLVPFTGTGPAMNALIADCRITSAIRSDRAACARRTVKALAVAGPKRHPALPDADQGCGRRLPQFSASPFYGISRRKARCSAGARLADCGARHGAR